MKNFLIFGIGFLAQLLFSSRILLQWVVSEKNKKVLTPHLFWQFSLFASMLLFIYGYLRHDFAIMLGQVLTYYIYIRNIQLCRQWGKFPGWLRGFFYCFPLIIPVYFFNNKVMDMERLFNPDHIPVVLMMLGIVSQVLFTLRFVYQWHYSEKRKESSLPMGFWMLSLSGSSLIFLYAVFRRDPVLLAGHMLGMIAYVRNIMILRKYPARAGSREAGDGVRGA